MLDFDKVGVFHLQTITMLFSVLQLIVACHHLLYFMQHLYRFLTFHWIFDGHMELKDRPLNPYAQVRPLIALTTLTLIFCVLQRNCGIHQLFPPADVSCCNMSSFPYYRTSFLLVLSFHFLLIALGKWVIRKACRLSYTNLLLILYKDKV